MSDVSTSKGIKYDPIFNKDHKHLNGDLNDLVRFLSSDHQTRDSGHPLPRFGVLTLLARRVPMYVYDHPMLAGMCDTAFTDGHHVFFYGPFLDGLLDEDAKNDTQSAVWLALHELSHILYLHHERFQRYAKTDGKLINRACDTSINTRILVNYPDVDPGGLKQIGIAMDWPNERRDAYALKSEEEIIREMLQEQKQQQQQNGAPGGGRKGQKGQEGPGDNNQSGTSQGGEPGAEAGKGGAGKQAGRSRPGQAGGTDQDASPSENHIISAEDFIEACEAAGMTDVLDKLQLPRSSEKEKIEALGDDQFQRVIGDIRKAQEIDRQSGGRMAGGHMIDAMSDYIRDLSRPKISWKMAVEDLLIGGGLHHEYTDDYPGDAYYFDPVDMGTVGEIYIGESVPAKPENTVIVLVDTSGSVDKDMLKSFFSEVFGLVDDATGSASEAIVMSADTVLRGEPMILTRENWEEKIEEVAFYGRGGTDMLAPLHGVMQLEMIKEKKKLGGIVYFSDLAVTAPRLSQLPEGCPPIVYVTTPEMADSQWARKFAADVESYATVAVIEDDAEVDLEAVRTKNQRAVEELSMGS